MLGRHVLVASVLIPLSVVSLGACKKDKEKKGEGAAKTAPVPADLQQKLAYMPLQSDGVIAIDLEKLRASELYRTYQKDIETAASSQLEEIRTLCGFDPLPKLARVIAGGAGKQRAGDATVIVQGLGKQETLGCLAKAAAAPPANVRITVDGDFATIEMVAGERVDVTPPPAGAPAAGAPAEAPAPGAPAVPPADAAPSPPPPTGPSESMSLQFVDDTTAVIARRDGKAVDKATMQAILAAKPGDAGNVTGSPGFMEMVEGVDTGAPVWFVLNGKADMVRRAGRGFLSFDAAFGHILVGSGLDIYTTLRLESPDAAKELADTVQLQADKMKKSLMKDMIGEVTVKQDGRDVNLRLQESREQLASLIEFAGAFVGGLVGE